MVAMWKTSPTRSGRVVLQTLDAPRVLRGRGCNQAPARRVDVRRDPSRWQEAGGLSTPDGVDRPWREARRDGTARDRGGDGHPGAARDEARRHPLRLHLGGRACLQGRLLLPAPLLQGPARGDRAGDANRGRRGPVAAARRGSKAPRVQRRAGDGRESPRVDTRARLIVRVSALMYALNFYSPIVADQLRSRRKTATIRLGDKSKKYKKGMVVQVLVGARYGPREKVFDAVIDKVEVKKLGELSPRDIEHDNPEVRRPEELAIFLGQLYNRDVTSDEIVTLIRFSEIRA